MRTISDGVFTPALTFSTTNPTGLVYGSQDGRYVKIGSMIQFWAKIVLTNKGTGGVGDLQMSLPFVARKPGAALVGQCLAVTFPTGMEQLVGKISANSGAMKLIGNDSAGAAAVAVTYAEIANTTEIEVSGSYILAE